MAQDQPPKPSGPPSRLGTLHVTSRPPTPVGGPVPFGELNDEDLRDIQELLSQETDVTRQDIQVQNFTAMIDRFTQGKKSE